MSTDAPDAYREAQDHAAAYVRALQEAIVQIMHLIGYASFEDEVLYSKAELARMERHKQAIEVLISDPSFNAKMPGLHK